jgi:alanine racemase
VTTAVGPARAHAEIDLAAYAVNVHLLKQRIGNAALMCVVKADAYGHGAVEISRAARHAGADWLGVAFVDEALALREAGDRGPLLAWLLNEQDDMAAALLHGIDLSVSSIRQLQWLRMAAVEAGMPLRVHIEVDSGLSRSGAAPSDWADLFSSVQGLEVVSIWSHLACADEPGHPSIDLQKAEYERALVVAREHGVTPRLRHIANSAATLTRSDLHYDLVRVGMASYGVSPMNDDAERFGLQRVMTVRASIAQVRDVPAGAGVSYGHRYITERPTRLALLPLGYADGLPRAGTNSAEVAIGEQHFRAAGTICMDQFVIDVGDREVAVGDDVVVFGKNGPSAEEWARACGTVGYEMTTRIGARLAKRFVGGV